jgi:hypothetical protein
MRLVELSGLRAASAERPDVLPAAYGSGSVVTIRGMDYGVAETQPDGTGLTTIRLRKRS